ncbi:MAG: EAL domain-containing protein [Clostridiales bacterium]|nr:EAL domain-containing protein [Clostridiales bacterium]
MKRIILIVDDLQLNRQILNNILCSEYEILDADNGKEALHILHQSYKDIAAVLLDIIMPVMDGFQLLERMQQNPALSQIPVIVTTGSTDDETELKALELGAYDFMQKPYNSAIIKQRIKNTIYIRETAAIMNAMRKDDLTGLYNRRTFFDVAGKMIAEHEPGYYVLSCFDIDKFKVINDLYGNETGDKILKLVASLLNERFLPIGGICARITADDFVMLYPKSFMDSEEMSSLHHSISLLDGSIQPIAFSVGRYIIEDLSVPVSGMYDRALLAQEAAKGRFDRNISAYDESMRAHLLREQKITSEMKSALIEGQFEVWFQPQYNHATGALVGAEALARWRHPMEGLLVPPGEFVPVFERNGFIYELDKYIWKESCITLKRWLDEGQAPLPVSVNISRYDILREDFIKTLMDLVKQYQVPVDLLQLEITESAFSESTDRIITVVKKLIDYGFTVEIDDFGSGYSSLNTLKDVPAQILKLDMKFLGSSEDADRSGNILESIVRMTDQLGMTVIAEGVETLEQADYLKSIGCVYVQGYLYAKPMPTDEYERLAKTMDKEHRETTKKM